MSNHDGSPKGDRTSPDHGPRVLLIRGVRGYLCDESFRLAYGQSVTVGRSRHCRFSLKQGRKFEETDGNVDAPEFLRVSREHLEISYPHPEMIEIRNLGRNGTRVGGQPIERVVLTEIGRPTRIDFGADEVLELTWIDDASANGSSNGNA